MLKTIIIIVMLVRFIFFQLYILIIASWMHTTSDSRPEYLFSYASTRQLAPGKHLKLLDEQVDRTGKI